MRWMEKCDIAFVQLKEYLSITLVLSNPQKEEKLYLYFAVSKVAMSLVLLREENGV